MKKLTSAIIILILLIAGVKAYVSFYADWLWFESLGYEEAFWTMFSTEYIVGFVFFIVFWILLGINLYLTTKTRSTAWIHPGGNAFGGSLAPVTRMVRLFFILGLLFISYTIASWASGQWLSVMRFYNSVPFDQTDSVFNNDIGFYVFELPFIQSLINWLFFVIIVMMIITAVVYFYKRAIMFEPSGVTFSPAAKRHLMGLFACIFLLYVFDYYYSAFGILYNNNGVVYGASYIDVNAVLFGYRVLSFMAAIGFILTIIGIIKTAVKYPIIGLAAQIGTAIILLWIYPAIVQKFVVTPNMLEKERPYIQENIRKTRMAYNLDQIHEKDFVYKQDLTAHGLKENHVTIKNITLWDYRPLKDSYSQLQEIRPYYMFNDIDIDRYVINGEYRQVMLSGRELNLKKIGSSDNWINKTFIYTHGHGIVMSPVNRVTQEGQPDFFIKNIPPDINVDIKLERPEIYFGEMQDNDDYIIIKTNKEEFDYPIGETNQHTFYKENSGVEIGSFGRKLLFAMHFGKMGILLNEYIQDQSRVVYHRNITDRVKKIAPYLKFDGDPYLVIGNGRLYWIYDAFTVTDQIPYSKMYFEKSNDPFGTSPSYNYIRNSVKVVIDAYNGQTLFYAFNPEKDPIIQVYSRIFENVYRPIADMPDFLRSHLRYPQDLFDIQARMYATYHIEDVNVFFNREDIWNIADEKYGDATTQMESYYAIMKLPGEAREEFIMMVPFTPNAKSNMISWFCVRSDGDQYGKLLVYRFPKTELVYGPIQVESRIDQTPDISEKLTLWNQQGSRVTRGNMIVIPVNNSIIYVEPLYLQSSQSKLPELKKVIIAFGNNIAMEDNLDLAFERVFGTSVSSEALEVPVKTVDLAVAGGTDKKENALLAGKLKSVRDLSRSALDNYLKSQESVRKGNWSKYGDDLDRLRRDLEKLVEISKGL